MSLAVQGDAAVSFGSARAWIPPRHRLRALWLGPHVLGLDAPLVALTWQHWWAQRAGIRLPLTRDVILGLAVWMVYLADRLVDARGLSAGAETVRHEFSRRWSRPLWVLLAFVTAMLVIVTLRALSLSDLRAGLVLLGVVGGYFGLVHRAAQIEARSAAPCRAAPKEAWVGALFALGTIFFPWRAGAAVHPALVVQVSLFAGLCYLNCALIAKWEQIDRNAEENARPLSGSPGLGAACVALAGAASLPVLLGRAAVGRELFPIVFGAVALAMLDACRKVLPKTVLRILADAALMGPAVLLWLG